MTVTGPPRWICRRKTGTTLPLDPAWVEEVFGRVERLVERRDEAYLAQALAELAREVFASVSTEVEDRARKDVEALAQQ